MATIFQSTWQQVKKFITKAKNFWLEYPYLMTSILMILSFVPIISPVAILGLVGSGLYYYREASLVVRLRNFILPQSTQVKELWKKIDIYELAYKASLLAVMNYAAQALPKDQKNQKDKPQELISYLKPALKQVIIQRYTNSFLYKFTYYAAAIIVGSLLLLGLVLLAVPGPIVSMLLFATAMVSYMVISKIVVDNLLAKRADAQSGPLFDKICKLPNIVAKLGELQENLGSLDLENGTMSKGNRSYKVTNLINLIEQNFFDNFAYWCYEREIDPTKNQLVNVNKDLDNKINSITAQQNIISGLVKFAVTIVDDLFTECLPEQHADLRKYIDVYSPLGEYAQVEVEDFVNQLVNNKDGSANKTYPGSKEQNVYPGTYTTNLGGKPNNKNPSKLP